MARAGNAPTRNSAGGPGVGHDHLSGDVWRAVFASLPDGVCILAADGVLVGANEAMCRMTGFSQKELLGCTPPFPYWPEDDVDVLRAMHDKIMLGDVVDFEVTFRRKNGELFPAHLHTCAITPKGGSLRNRYFLATTKNITDRMRKESDLRRSEQRWQSIAENPYDFVTVVDRDYKYTYVNHTAPGIRLEDLIGKATPFDFIDPVSLGAAQAAMSRAFREGIATFYEAFSPQLDQWFGSVVGPIFEDGIVTSLSILTRDITESKRAENAVRQSEHRLQLALAGGDVGAFDLTVINGELYCSPHLYRLLGYAGDDPKRPLTLLDFVGRFHPDDRTDMEATLRQALNDEAALDLEFRMKTAADIYRWFHGRGRSFHEADGVTHFSGFVTDVTERRLANEQRIALEAQLRHGQKLETLGTLAGGIAHDFNNLLVPILGNAQLALRTIPVDAPGRSEIEDIVRAAARARELVSRILVFGRRAEEKREPVDLPTVIREVLGFLKASIPSNVQIVAHVDDACPLVMGDPNQIHQALTNVCANAYQALGSRGGRVDVGIEAVNLDAAFAEAHDMHPGRAVCISIEDSGPGIAPDVLQRIFEPFFTTKGPGEGTGLGLAVVHAILTKHEGTVTARSREGLGAIFQLYFPADPRAVPRAAVEEGLLQPAAISSHIACVDDEPGVLRALVRILKSAGHVVTPFASAVEALNHIRKSPSAFDAVVTDLTMPDMGGIELALRLAEVEPNLPLVLVTGYGEAALGPGRLADNIRAYLEKPLDVDALITAVARALAERSKAATTGG